MGLVSQDYVSIVELIIYIPALIAAIIVTARHGFHRASGWIYTVVLCAVRIAGAICQLLTHTDHSEGLLTASIVIDSIGISPLLLATLGVLSRLYAHTPTRYSLQSASNNNLVSTSSTPKEFSFSV